MRDIHRRIGTIEQKLRLSDKSNEVQTIVLQYVYSRRGGLRDISPGPPEVWLTYKKQFNNEPVDGYRFIYLDPDEELKARAVPKEAVRL
ncbi:MAG: hypothetical protein ACYTDW_07180 [Planctomycetota bacterium]|jgi:hypothetical protein